MAGKSGNQGSRIGDRMYIVLMAGGVGSRFWPRSRKELPKQMLNLLGEQSMLQMTYERIKPLVDPENILVITNTELSVLAAEQLPDLPAQNIIAEPFGRNTAPCIGLAAAIIQSRSTEDEVMVTLPADHLIVDDEKFRQTIRAAGEYANQRECLVTLGVKPGYPETGYGYIQRGEEIALAGGLPVYKVKTFAEKPNPETAKRFIKSGDFLWNSGMFIWSVDMIMQEFTTHEPEMAEGFKQIRTAAGTDSMADVIFDVYSKLRSISIDYAIMETAEHVCIIEADFIWNDLGSWEAAYNIAEKDEQGNAIQAQFFQAFDSENNYIYTPKKVVAMVGVDNLVVVETDDALLICKKDQSQKVKEVVDALRRKKMDHII